MTFCEVLLLNFVYLLGMKIGKMMTTLVTDQKYTDFEHVRNERLNGHQTSILRQCSKFAYQFPPQKIFFM